MERHIVACAKKKFKKQDFSCLECKLIFGAKQTLEKHIGNVERQILPLDGKQAP